MKISANNILLNTYDTFASIFDSFSDSDPDCPNSIASLEPGREKEP